VVWILGAWKICLQEFCPDIKKMLDAQMKEGGNDLRNVINHFIYPEGSRVL